MQVIQSVLEEPNFTNKSMERGRGVGVSFDKKIDGDSYLVDGLVSG